MYAFHKIVQERRGMKDIFTSPSGIRPHLQAELFRPSLQYPSYPYAEMLTRTAERYPEHIAVIFLAPTRLANEALPAPPAGWPLPLRGQASRKENDVNLTYRELEALVNAFAHALLDLGISRGQTVCLLMTNRAEYVISWFAIARIGAVASPMNPSYKEREIAYQISNSDAAAIVVQHELLPLVEAVRAQTPTLEHIIAVGSDEDMSPAQGAIHRAPTLSFSELLRSHPTTSPTSSEPGWEDLV